jgi:hypothetical protein
MHKIQDQYQKIYEHSVFTNRSPVGQGNVIKWK